jgi:hypothetical protein
LGLDVRRGARLSLLASSAVRIAQRAESKATGPSDGGGNVRSNRTWVTISFRAPSALAPASVAYRIAESPVSLLGVAIRSRRNPEKRVRPEENVMRFRALWQLAGLIFVLMMAVGVFTLTSGCAERYLPFLDLHDSHLVTPSGPVPFETADDWRNPGFASNQSLMVRAQAPELGVLVAVFPGVQEVFVRNMSRAFMIDVVAGSSWYRLNTEPKVPLTLTRRDDDIRASKSPVSLDFELPAPLSLYDITVHGGTLQSSGVDIIRAHEGDTHHLYLPFSADGEMYAVNLTFSVGVRSFNVVGAPGTP